MKRLHVNIKFEEPILGTAASNSEIHHDYIASKAPDAKSKEEEVAAIGVDGVEEKAMTIFPKDENGNPIIWNYQIKGFFKEACSMLQRMKGESCAKESCAIKAYKKIIDGVIEPSGSPDGTNRKIPLIIPDGQKIGNLQRPLRGQTAQGERIALANSEMLPAGTMAEFYVITPNAYEKAIIEWLNYGRFHGISQWRNAGFGRFSYEMLDIDTF